MKTYKILRYFFALCLLFFSGLSVGVADFVISDGKIINQNNGPIEFDLSDDGNSDITMSTNGNLGIGVTNPSSTIDLAGTIGFSTELHTSSGVISGNSLVLADTTSSDITLTLPNATTVPGRVYQIKKLTWSNNLIINASTNIDAGSNVVLTSSANGFPYVNLFSSGTQWYITSKSH